MAMTKRQTMTDKSDRSISHRDAVEAVRDADTFAVTLPGFGRVRVPRPDQLAYYAALAGLAALEIIDWPIALAIGAGHALANSHHNKFAQEIGEALEEA
jgi:hypothetical protein